MDYSLLSSQEEHKNFFKEKNRKPYTFEVRGKGKVLYYFGANHSRDPENIQWGVINEYWGRFIKEAGANRVVFLEGPQFIFSEGKSEEETIRQFGERGFVITRAIKENIAIHWADLQIQEEIKKLNEGFEKELVNYFIFARSAGAWLRAGTFGPFDSVIEKAAVSTAKRIEGAPSDSSYYAAIHNKIFGKPFSDSDARDLERAAAPINNDSIINDVARASSRLRNEHIVSEIEKFWLKGFSIFVLFGSGHAIVQERALKSLPTD